MEQLELLEKSKLIALKLQEFGAKKIELLDLSRKSTDIKFLILSNVSNAQMAKVVANDIQQFANAQGLEISHIDGAFRGEWIVIDCEDIIIHIFTEQARIKYNLEKLWKDSKNSIKFDI